MDSIADPHTPAKPIDSGVTQAELFQQILEGASDLTRRIGEITLCFGAAARVTVPAILIGPFAIHRAYALDNTLNVRLCSGWRISHRETGHHALDCESLPEALMFTGVLLTDGPRDEKGFVQADRATVERLRGAHRIICQAVRNVSE